VWTAGLGQRARYRRVHHLHRVHHRVHCLHRVRLRDHNSKNSGPWIGRRETFSAIRFPSLGTPPSSGRTRMTTMSFSLNINISIVSTVKHASCSLQNFECKLLELTQQQLCCCVPSISHEFLRADVTASTAYTSSYRYSQNFRYFSNIYKSSTSSLRLLASASLFRRLRTREQYVSRRNDVFFSSNSKRRTSFRTA